MSHSMKVKKRAPRAREVILWFVRSTGKTAFEVSEVVTWLRKQGIMVTDAAIRSALWRLSKKGLAKKIGKRLWSVDVDGLAFLVNNKRKGTTELATKLAKVIVDLLTLIME